MKRTPAVLLALMLAASPASAATIVYTTVLSGANEVPANPSPGTGTGRVTIDDILGSMRVEVEFSGLVAGVTASHIHVEDGPGDPTPGDGTGPVATQTPSFAGFPSGVTLGSYDQTFDLNDALTYRPGFVTAAGGVDGAKAALLAALEGGRAYLNVHSSTYPAGEIRGPLAREAVPEPAAMTLLALALAGLGARRLRR